jgi:hypothetical protein
MESAMRSLIGLLGKADGEVAQALSEQSWFIDSIQTLFYEIECQCGNSSTLATYCALAAELVRKVCDSPSLIEGILDKMVPFLYDKVVHHVGQIDSWEIWRFVWILCSCPSYSDHPFWIDVFLELTVTPLLISFAKNELVPRSKYLPKLFTHLSGNVPNETITLVSNSLPQELLCDCFLGTNDKKRANGLLL